MVWTTGDYISGDHQQSASLEGRLGVCRRGGEGRRFTPGVWGAGGGRGDVSSNGVSHAKPSLTGFCPVASFFSTWVSGGAPCTRPVTNGSSWWQVIGSHPRAGDASAGAPPTPSERNPCSPGAPARPLADVNRAPGSAGAGRGPREHRRCSASEKCRGGVCRRWHVEGAVEGRPAAIAGDTGRARCRRTCTRGRGHCHRPGSDAPLCTRRKRGGSGQARSEGGLHCRPPDPGSGAKRHNVQLLTVWGPDFQWAGLAPSESWRRRSRPAPQPLGAGWRPLASPGLQTHLPDRGLHLLHMAVSLRASPCSRFPSV